MITIENTVCNTVLAMCGCGSVVLRTMSVNEYKCYPLQRDSLTFSIELMGDCVSETCSMDSVLLMIFL